MASRFRLAFLISFIALVTLGLLVFGCGDDGPTDPPGDDDDDDTTPPDTTEIRQRNERSADLDTLGMDLAELIDSLGTEDALDSILTIAQSDPLIESAGKSSQGIWIRYKIGDDKLVTGGIIVDPEFYDSSVLSKTALPVAPIWQSSKTGNIPSSKKTLYMSPVYSELQSVIPGVVDDVIQQSESALTAAKYQPFDVLTDGECKVARFAELDEYGIVRIHSHGNPWPSNQSPQRVYTPTGEERSEATDIVYRDDLFSGDLAWTVRNGKTYYYVSSDFVGSHNSFSANKTFVSLGFNYSDLGNWPDAIISTGGAAATVAYDWIVSGQQEADWTIDFFKEMSDTTLGEPLTMSEWFSSNTTSAPGGTQPVTINRNGAGETAFWSNIVLDCADSLVALADARLEEIVMAGFDNFEENYNLADIEDAYDLYFEALACDPDHLDANLGAAVTVLLAFTTDSEVMNAVDQWQTYLEDNVPFAVQSSGKKPLGIPLSFSGGAGAFKLPFDIVPMTLIAASKQSFRRVDPSLIVVQDVLEEIGLPRLEAAMGFLDKLVDAHDYTNIVTPRMQGDPEEEPVEIDQTDVRALRAASALLASAIHAAVSYEIAFPAYDSLSLYNALKPGSDWLTLRPGGADHLLLSQTLALDAIDFVDSAITSLDREIDNQDDDLIKIGPDSLSQADLDSVRANLQPVREALTVGASRWDNWDGKDSTAHTLLMVNANRIFTDPVEDWKALLPAYSVEFEIEPWGGESEEDPTTPETESNFGIVEFFDITVSEQRTYSGTYEFLATAFGDSIETSATGDTLILNLMEGYVAMHYDSISQMPDWVGVYEAHSRFSENLDSGFQQIAIEFDGFFTLDENKRYFGDSPCIPETISVDGVVLIINCPVYNPVLVWEADDVESWIWPDPTLNGFFPEITTTEEFLTTFGIDADDWEKRFVIPWNEAGNWCLEGFHPCSDSSETPSNGGAPPPGGGIW